MKHSNDFVYNRRRQIYNILRTQGEVRVDVTASSFGVSPLTIRRDLEHFENMGLVERFYGGARLTKTEPNENIFSSPLDLNKQAIARRAASFVEDGDIIFINTSSTALLMLDYIEAQHVTVVTNNGNALTCNIRNNLTVVLTGGEIRIPKESMVGAFAINNLNMVTAAKSFLGVSGLSAQAGLSTAVLQEVAIDKIMLERVTGKRTILADFTKIGLSNKFISGSISDVDRLVTDMQADPWILNEFLELGVEVVQVDPFQELNK